MTNIPNSFPTAGWWYQSGNWRLRQWEQKWGHMRNYVIIRHQWRRFRSPAAGPTSKPGTPGQVITYYKGSIANEPEQCRHCDCMPSPPKSPKTTWVNGTTTAQTPKGSPPQHILRVWPCSISRGAATTQVTWSQECSTAHGQWQPECSEIPKGDLWGRKKVHGGNVIHKNSVALSIQWHILDGWRSLETCHWCSGRSVGISRCFCRYTIGVSIAQRSISHNQSANATSCKCWILFNAPISDLQYWLCPKLYIVELKISTIRGRFADGACRTVVQTTRLICTLWLSFGSRLRSLCLTLEISPGSLRMWNHGSCKWKCFISFIPNFSSWQVDWGASQGLRSISNPTCRGP